LITQKLDFFDEQSSPEQGTRDLTSLIQDCFKETAEQVKAECETLKQDTRTALLTTLIVAVVPAWKLTAPGEGGTAWLAWIGDSPIFVLNPKEPSHLLMNPTRSANPENGLTETVPTETLTTHGQRVTVKAQQVGNANAILLTTDGFGNALIEEHSAQLVAQVSAFMTSNEDPHPLEFLRILDFRDADCNDDRTAVAIWRP